MSQRFDQLKARHSELLLRTAAQREQLADTAGDLQHDLGRIDRGIQSLRRVVRSPLLLVGGVVVLGVLGPKRVLGWAARGLMYYSTARRLVDARSAGTITRTADADARVANTDARAADTQVRERATKSASLPPLRGGKTGRGHR